MRLRTAILPVSACERFRGSLLTAKELVAGLNDRDSDIFKAWSSTVVLGVSIVPGTAGIGPAPLGALINGECPEGDCILIDQIVSDDILPDKRRGVDGHAGRSRPTRD